MNDVINRKDAIGAILSVGHIAELSDGDAVIRVSAVNYVLRNLPSAQPEPHEGRFERKRDGVFCSVCHYGWEFITGVPAEVEREYHYCPNCGADMRGKQDG